MKHAVSPIVEVRSPRQLSMVLAAGENSQMDEAHLRLIAVVSGFNGLQHETDRLGNYSA